MERIYFNGRHKFKYDTDMNLDGLDNIQIKDLLKIVINIKEDYQNTLDTWMYNDKDELRLEMKELIIEITEFMWRLIRAVNNE